MSDERTSGPADDELREPPLPAGRDMDRHLFMGLHYRRYKGDLFVGRVSGSAVGQGDLGDCYFLSSLVAFANTDPRAVRRAIRDNGDGTYTVTFQERKHGKVRPVRVRVDSKFPADLHGAQKFGKGLRTGPHGQELWPALFEKAFAALRKGYVHINQGGDGGHALASLTGKPSKTLTPNRHSADALWRELVHAAKARDAMITGTPATRELEHRTGRRDLAGLIEDHYYAVLGTVKRRGRRFVRLYTPLVDFTAAPVGTPSPRDNAQRKVELALEDYRRYFDELVVNSASVIAPAARRCAPSARSAWPPWRRIRAWI